MFPVKTIPVQVIRPAPVGQENRNVNGLPVTEHVVGQFKSRPMMPATQQPQLQQQRQQPQYQQQLLQNHKSTSKGATSLEYQLQMQQLRQQHQQQLVASKPPVELSRCYSSGISAAIAAVPTTIALSTTVHLSRCHFPIHRRSPTCLRNGTSERAPSGSVPCASSTTKTLCCSWSRAKTSESEKGSKVGSEKTIERLYEEAEHPTGEQWKSQPRNVPRSPSDPAHPTRPTPGSNVLSAGPVHRLRTHRYGLPDGNAGAGRAIPAVSTNADSADGPTSSTRKAIGTRNATRLCPLVQRTRGPYHSRQESRDEHLCFVII